MGNAFALQNMDNWKVSIKYPGQRYVPYIFSDGIMYDLAKDLSQKYKYVKWNKTAKEPIWKIQSGPKEESRGWTTSNIYWNKGSTDEVDEGSHSQTDVSVGFPGIGHAKVGYGTGTNTGS